MIEGPDEKTDETAGQRADPVAARNQDAVQAGGPAAGERGAAGAGFGAGPAPGGAARPSGEKAESEAPISSDVAPVVHTAMDDSLRAIDEQVDRLEHPRAVD